MKDRRQKKFYAIVGGILMTVSIFCLFPWNILFSVISGRSWDALEYRNVFFDIKSLIMLGVGTYVFNSFKDSFEKETKSSWIVQLIESLNYKLLQLSPLEQGTTLKISE